MSYAEHCKTDGIKRTFTTWLKIFPTQKTDKKQEVNNSKNQNNGKEKHSK